MPPKSQSKPRATPLERVDSRMVKGLPGSPEAVEWLLETLAAAQRQDPRLDVDLGAVEQRLRDLEARTGVDLGPVWDAIGALARRVVELEERPPVDLSGILARLAALESASAQQVLTPPPPANLDPLDPANWSSIDSAKAALLVLITREAARRCGHKVELYEKMCRLDALGERRSRDEDIQLLQHEGWAKERQQVELARLTHNAAIGGLESVEDAARYDWQSGWPEIVIHDAAPA